MNLMFNAYKLFSGINLSNNKANNNNEMNPLIWNSNIIIKKQKRSNRLKQI